MISAKLLNSEECVVHNFVQAGKRICGSIMEKRSTLLVLQLPMLQQLVIMVIVLMIATSARFFVSAGGYTGDTHWTPGHATFYGGDDASGTQGELSLSVCLSFDNRVGFQLCLLSTVGCSRIHF